jgi:hypothetical protein
MQKLYHFTFIATFFKDKKDIQTCVDICGKATQYF